MNMSVTKTFAAETKVNIIWFRHGLRLHDNPALLEAIADKVKGVALIPLFIFDGETAGIKNVGYNRMSFLLDSLHDIDEQLRELSGDNGCLHMFQGKPNDIFRSIHQYVRIEKICFEQDCEPIWKERDDSVRNLCLELGIQVVEKVSHTLWDPRQIIRTNGGIPPLTYQMFLHTVQVMGFPERPVQNADWNEVSFFKFTDEQLLEFGSFPQFPIPEDLNIYRDDMINMARFKWRGGERQALVHLNERLIVEEKSFKQGLYLPNQANPNILETSKSMSAHLRFGCLSVRRFYWDIHDLFRNVQQQAAACGFELPGGAHITGQLIWREYFYTMSVNNPNYDRMEGNDICLNIPWAPKSDDQLQRWQRGQTGFPIIDAAMRQLLAEGWLHHTLRNTVAMFLTRGGLWQNWEYGLQHFLKYLLDADWSVCAGNWMWVSSSAFEGLLDSSMLSCPVMLSKRLDPQGEYIRHYVDELKHLPKEYVHNPWLMTSAMQNQYNCILGVNYPERMIDLTVALQRNTASMKALRKELIENGESTEGSPHCRPSNEQEIRQLFWLFS